MLIRAAESAEDVGMVASRIALFDQHSRLDSAGMAIYPDLLARQRGRRLSTWEFYRLLRRHRISAREIAWQE